MRVRPAAAVCALALAASVAAWSLSADAAAKAPKPGTWKSFAVTNDAAADVLLLDTTTGAMQLEYLDGSSPKTFLIAAPADAPRGANDTYAISPRAIVVPSGMGPDTTALLMLNTATGASWYLNGRSAWVTVGR